MSGMIIQTNMSAINAHNKLKAIGKSQSKTTAKLSSGLRINSAADDAAGLAISEKMRAQIRGLDMAAKNAQEGISLIQTADGAMSEMDNMLHRMRELSVQAANDTNDSFDREKIDDEFQQLKKELDEIALRTEFNKKTLLDGTYAKPKGTTGTSASMAATGSLSYFVINQPAIPVAPMAAGIMPVAAGVRPTTNVTIDTGSFATGVSTSGAGWNFNGSVLTITGNDSFEIKGTGAVNALDRIKVQSGAMVDIVLNDVNIVTSTGPALDMGSATVNLWLEGTNRLETTEISSASLRTTNSVMVIDGTGELTTIGGSGVTAGGGSVSGAGMGGNYGENCGKITISSGIINAIGGNGGTGIGSSVFSSGGEITINGGTVTATARNGTGIGAADFSSGVKITINGGMVTATSDGYGAGIGVSQGSSGSEINISGGTVIATGGTGIGGGASGGSIGIINIIGGTVIATGSSSGVGIGGYMGCTGGEINISGGNVTANGGNYSSAGIGVGRLGFIDKINISDGTIVAAGSQGGAGIGSGGSGSVGEINIHGGTVAATGSSYGAGIGGGADGSVGEINIHGGTVTAIGGDSGAGIGGGLRGSGGEITISGGVVTATGGINAAAVGGGADGVGGVGNGGNLTISGGVLEILSGWIGGGDGSSDHGTTHITGGTLVISDPVNNIKSGVTNTAGQYSSVADALQLYTVSVLPSEIGFNLPSEQPIKYVVNGTDTYTWLADPIPHNNGLYLFLPDESNPGETTNIDIYYGGKIYKGYTEVQDDYTSVWNLMSIELDLPALTPGTVNRTDDNNATVKFNSNKTGTYYYIVQDSNASAPSDSDVRNFGSSDNGNIGQNTIDLNTLTPGEKKIYIVVEDGDGNLSNLINMTIPPYNPPQPPVIPPTPGTSGNGIRFQIGANVGQSMSVYIESMRVSDLGITNNTLRSPTENAMAAIRDVDNALSKVVAQRAILGAYQNRLEHTVSSLNVSSENLSSAESRIRDADMAKEMMSFTKLNILQQAATAMLTQANQAPQSVLQLLK